MGRFGWLNLGLKKKKNRPRLYFSSGCSKSRVDTHITAPFYPLSQARDNPSQGPDSLNCLERGTKAIIESASRGRCRAACVSEGRARGGGVFPSVPQLHPLQVSPPPPLQKPWRREASEAFGNAGNAYKAVLWGQDTGERALDWESGIHVCHETLDTPASRSPPVK